MKDPTAAMNRNAGRSTGPKTTAIGAAVRALVAQRREAEAAAQADTPPKRRRRVKPKTSGEVHVARAKAGTPEIHPSKPGILSPEHR